MLVKPQARRPACDYRLCADTKLLDAGVRVRLQGNTRSLTDADILLPAILSFLNLTLRVRGFVRAPFEEKTIMFKSRIGFVLAACTMMVAASAQAHFQLAYTPEVNIARAGDQDVKLIFWHPFETGMS